MKNYLGKGRQGKFDIINCTICLDDLPKDAIFEYKGKMYFKFCIGQMKEPDKYDKTHTIWLDEFKPEKKEPEVKEEPKMENGKINVEENPISHDDTLPF